MNSTTTGADKYTLKVRPRTDMELQFNRKIEQVALGGSLPLMCISWFI